MNPGQTQAEGDLRWAAASFHERPLAFFFTVLRKARAYGSWREKHVRSVEHVENCECGWGRGPGLDDVYGPPPKPMPKLRWPAKARNETIEEIASMFDDLWLAGQKIDIIAQRIRALKTCQHGQRMEQKCARCGR